MVARSQCMPLAENPYALGSDQHPGWARGWFHVDRGIMQGPHAAGRNGDPATFPPGRIRTISGRWVDPLRLDPADVCIEDIAHSLAMQCRWNGHIREFLSVAEHSVLVSYACDPADAMWGLLHDASEAYLCDLPRPIKGNADLGSVYLAMESLAMGAICKALGLPEAMPESVRAADDLILVKERAFFEGDGVCLSERAGSLRCGIRLLSPPRAKQAFLERFSRLKQAM